MENDAGSIENYLEKVKNMASDEENSGKRGDWGSLIEIKAVSAMFNVNIDIYELISNTKDEKIEELANTKLLLESEDGLLLKMQVYMKFQ